MADKLFTTEALRHKGGKADELVDRSARQARRLAAGGLMGCLFGHHKCQYSGE
jgi:hypothetical protein